MTTTTEQHTDLTDRLKQAMNDEYLAVDRRKNPVALALDTMSRDQMLYILHQYSLFPKVIIAFLDSARKTASNTGWYDVAAELDRNIGEELGSDTAGTPHYDLLVRGIKEELNVDIGEAYPNPSTSAFLACMYYTMPNPRQALAVGAAYALESTAVPELRIVLELANKAVRTTSGKPMDKDGTLQQFFEKHLSTWEPGHEERLRTATAKYIITEKDQREFEQGFRYVMKTMDEWWTGLAKEMSDGSIVEYTLHKKA